MESEPSQRSFLQKFFGTNLPNPGKFEDMSNEANKIFLLDTFEGVRIDWQRPLSNAFGVSHLLHLQPAADTYGTYHFGANFAENQHLVLSRTGTNGNVDARYIMTATPNLTVSCQSQLSATPHQSMAVVGADYKGSDYFAQFKFGSMAQYGFSYLQSVTRNLSLGLDFLYIGRPPYPGVPPIAHLTGGLRYATERLALSSSLNLSQGQLKTNYVQRVKDNLNFGTELLIDLANGKDSTCSLGYEYSTQQGAFKSNLTTDGKVTSVFEKQLNEMSSLSLAFECDHGKKAVKYGIGFQFMQ